jgi:hypothetical protein
MHALERAKDGSIVLSEEWFCETRSVVEFLMAVVKRGTVSVDGVTPDGMLYTSLAWWGSDDKHKPWELKKWKRDPFQLLEPKRDTEIN